MHEWGITVESTQQQQQHKDEDEKEEELSAGLQCISSVRVLFTYKYTF